jgi:hypothetical protein
MAACSRGEKVFVERLGLDTMAVEVYSRTPGGFQGQRLVRNPVTQLLTYTAQLSPAGTITHLDVEWTTPTENPNGPPAYGFTVTITDRDSALIERRGGSNPGADRIAVPPGTIPDPGANPMSMAFFEQATIQWAMSARDSIGISLLNPARSSMSSNFVRREPGDSVSMNYFGNPVLAAVDPQGGVLGRSGQRTTIRIVDELGDKPDLTALAADFAARDVRGEGVGRASPPGTATLTSAGATVSIDYSRPRKRGREIFGHLVAYNQVWRTGANAATMFRTDRDLRMGNTRIPAGEYTLFSTYTPDGGTLIINSQTGQWGTAYDPQQNFASIPMVMSTLDEPVEMFTITLEPTNDGGVLHLAWDRTRYSVRFTTS